MPLHPLLRHQIKRAAARAADGVPDMDALLAAVSDTYDQMDRDRRLTERAMTLLQEEIEGLAATWKSDAEDQVKAVMDFMGEAMISINERGTILAFNTTAETLFDYPAAEVVGGNIKLLMGEEDARHHDGYLARYIETGQAAIIRRPREVQGRRRDGTLIPIELNVGEMLIRGPGRRFIGLIRDLSARKRMEQELRDSEARFRDLAGSASDWFWETDAAHRITYISGRVREVLGIDATDLIGQDRFAAGLGGSTDTDRARHRRTLDARRAFRSLVCYLQHPRRGPQVVRLSGRPIVDGAGTFQGYRGTGVDITREMAALKQAEQAQSQFIQAIENVTEGFALFDGRGRLVICNEQFRATFASMADHIRPGVSFSTINSVAMAAGLYHMVGAEAAPWLDERLNAHIEAAGRPIQLPLPDGRWVECRDFRTRDGGTLVVQADITAAKTREMALARLRQRYELILQATADGIIAYDADGRVSFANRAAAIMLGRTEDELVGATDPHALFHSPPGNEKNSHARTRCPVLRALTDGEEAVAGDDLFWHRDGSSFPVEYYVAALEVDGVRSGMVLTFRDVTLRRQYETALADQQRRLETLVERRTATLQAEVVKHQRTQAALAALAASQNRMRNISDNLFEGVLVVDLHGVVVEANRSARRTLAGDSEHHLASTPLDQLFQVMVEYVPQPFATSPLRQVSEARRTMRDDDAQFRLPDGTILPVAYACAPLLEKERCLGVVLSFRDIGALKRAQRDAAQSARLASVGQLAAGIAHEINTPVQYIGDNLRFFTESFDYIRLVLGAHDALEAAAAAERRFPEQRAAIATAREEADLAYLLDEVPQALAQSLQGVQQVTEIVRSMKEFSHPGSTTMASADINRALESTLTVSRNVWKHHARIELDLAPDLPLVTCLPGAINQVFLNLIINAADAIAESQPEAEGIIRISTRHADGWVEIRIADNGPGVPDDLRDRIFDPFFTTKEVGKGTGQGLMICRDVVARRHGGQLYLDPQVVEGATFVVRLPVSRDEEVCDD